MSLCEFIFADFHRHKITSVDFGIIITDTRRESDSKILYRPLEKTRFPVFYELPTDERLLSNAGKRFFTLLMGDFCFYVLYLPGCLASLQCGSVSLGQRVHPQSCRCQQGWEAGRPSPLPQSEGSTEAVASYTPPTNTHTSMLHYTVHVRTCNKRYLYLFSSF